MSILELCVHEECNEQEASGFKVFCCLEAVARSTRVREEYTGEIPGYLPTGAPSILFRGKGDTEVSTNMSSLDTFSRKARGTYRTKSHGKFEISIGASEFKFQID